MINFNAEPNVLYDAVLDLNAPAAEAKVGLLSEVELRFVSEVALAAAEIAEALGEKVTVKAKLDSPSTLVIRMSRQGVGVARMSFARQYLTDAIYIHPSWLAQKMWTLLRKTWEGGRVV